MPVVQKEQADGKNTEHKDVRKLLNDVMSSYFNEQPAGSGLPAGTVDIEALLEEINSDAASVSGDDTGCNANDSADESVPETEVPAAIKEEIKEENEAELNIFPENSLFSDAFSKVEFQSVEVAIPQDDPLPVPSQDDAIYAKIVSDALKAVPHQPVATVLDTLYEKPVSKKASKPEDCVFPDKGIPTSEDSHVKKTSVKHNSLPDSKESASSVLIESPVSVNKTAVKDSVPSRKSSVGSRHRFSFNEKKDVKADDIAGVAPAAAPKVLPAGNIAFVYNRRHTEHDPCALSVKTLEVPDRIIKAMWYLEKNRVFEDSRCTLMDNVDMATEEDLLRAHDESYIRFISNYASNGGGFLGDSTYITPHSFDIAKLSAGAAIKAGDMVTGGNYSFSFVMTRPPGHHAGKSKYGGFCLFNNAAILARYLQEVKKIEKIMILDWDAHAGDGTMDIFYDDPMVLTLSLHRDPHGFYPRRGFTSETGNDAGKGYSVNIEMPKGAGDEEYLYAFDEVVMPLVERFSPGFVICPCGFDAHHKEKNVGLRLTSEGFYGMTSKLRSAYSGGIVFLMEGGYHDFNGQLCHSVLSALEGKPNPVKDTPDISSYKQDQQKRIFEETVGKVAEVKKVIPLLW